jgi:antitoxin StbD
MNRHSIVDETCLKTYYQVMNKPFKPTPVLPIMADVSASISDLKKNPAAVIEEARRRQVAITSRNRAVAYVISPEVWDHILDVFEDRKFEREFAEHLGDIDEAIPVDLDELLK